MNENNLNNNNLNQNNQTLPNQNLNQYQSPDRWIDLTGVGDSTPKKKNPFLKIFIVIIVLCALGGAGYYTYQEFIVKKDIKSNSDVDDTQKNQEEKEEQTPLENKDYVIDATYEAKVIEGTNTSYSEMYKVSDIVVPYLNIETNEAKEINNEIKKLYDEFIERYNAISQVEVIPRQGEYWKYDYIKTSYKYTDQNNIISILIKVELTGRGGSEAEEYYAFNYDLKEEKRLYLLDLCNKFNLNYDSTLKQVNEALDKSLIKTFELTEPISEEFIEFIKENKENFNEELKNKKENIYIDENNQLNVITLNNHPTGSGFYYEFVAITK